MKTISIINLKGGVAKTLTADSMAHVLATLHNKRVLLVDNDKQGNTSKAFGVHSYDDKSISDVLTARRLDPREVIKKTRFQNIDVHHHPDSGYFLRRCAVIPRQDPE